MSEGLDTVIGGGAIDEARADAVFKQGLDCESAGDRLGAIVAYREAGSHCGKPEHLHRLAYLLDLVGEEEEATQPEGQEAGDDDSPGELTYEPLSDDASLWSDLDESSDSI